MSEIHGAVGSYVVNALGPVGARRVRGPPGRLPDLQPRGRRVLRDRGRAVPARHRHRRRHPTLRSQHPVGDQGGPAAAARVPQPIVAAGRADSPRSRSQPTGMHPRAGTDRRVGRAPPAAPDPGAHRCGRRRHGRRAGPGRLGGLRLVTARQSEPGRPTRALETQLFSAPDVAGRHTRDDEERRKGVVRRLQGPEPGHVRRRPTCPDPGPASATSCGHRTMPTPCRTTSSTAAPAPEQFFSGDIPTPLDLA